MSRTAHSRLQAFIAAAVILSVTGCTSLHDYVHNGFKVGPNYCPPPAPVAEHWIDQADFPQTQNPEILACWWKVFNDPKLNDLVWSRLPAKPDPEGGRLPHPSGPGPARPSPWATSSRKRKTPRAVTSGSACPSIRRYRSRPPGFTTSGVRLQSQLGAGLLGPLPPRGDRRRRRLAGLVPMGTTPCWSPCSATWPKTTCRCAPTKSGSNCCKTTSTLQRGVLKFIETRFRAGFRQTELDYDQALSTLRQTEAQILPLAIDARQAEDLLSILMGMPPADLEPMLGIAPIPTLRPRWPSACRPTCFAAARTSARRNVWRPRRANKSVSPKRTCIRPSPSTATWAGGQELSRSVQKHGLQRLGRPVVPMESAELRPDHQ